MTDIPVETTISRYAIPARNLLMRCEASFPAPTPKERSAPGQKRLWRRVLPGVGLPRRPAAAAILANRERRSLRKWSAADTFCAPCFVLVQRPWGN